MESIGPLAPTASPLTRISERNPPFQEIVQPLAPPSGEAASSSCPDLIRASINLQKTLSEKMDHRVKPGDDMLVGLPIFPDGQNQSAPQIPVWSQGKTTTRPRDGFLKFRNFACQRRQISSLIRTVPSRKRGVAHVTNVGRGMRWTRLARDGRIALTRTAKSCGFDAPMLASSLR